MAVVVFGIENSDELWVADTENGTVEKLADVSGELAAVNDLRKAGGSFIKRVNLAVSVSAAAPVFSGHLDG